MKKAWRRVGDDRDGHGMKKRDMMDGRMRADKDGRERLNEGGNLPASDEWLLLLAATMPLALMRLLGGMLLLQCNADDPTLNISQEADG
jgi:hypothetical protein